MYLQAMLHPLVAAGIALQILWMLCRMALLSRVDLSFVLPATASGYVLTALLGRFFLAEQITLEHWIGILFIFAGSSLVGATRLNTTARPKRQSQREVVASGHIFQLGNIAE